MNNDVNYNEFYKWSKSIHHGIYELQIDGLPDSIKATTLRAIPSPYKKNMFPGTHASSNLLGYLAFDKYVISTPIHREIIRFMNDKMRYTIGNNLVERSIRPLTCERKVSSFYGSHEGADLSVVYPTFVESCKLACVSVKDYFVKFFESIAAGRTDYENLLPTTIGLKQ